MDWRHGREHAHTRYKMHGFNFRTGSSSVGATGSAVEAECSMDIRGQFVNRDGLLGIVATLTDVGFSMRHNFNLLRVTSLCSTSTLLSLLVMTSRCKIVRTAKSKLLSKEGVGSSNPVLKQFLMVWDNFI
jgi:hypothetical protein